MKLFSKFLEGFMDTTCKITKNFNWIIMLLIVQDSIAFRSRSTYFSVLMDVYFELKGTCLFVILGKSS